MKSSVVPSRLFVAILFVIICLAVWRPLSLRAQDQTVNGNLGVSGAMDVYGNAFNLGSWSNDNTKYGLNVSYAEDSSHAATLTLNTTRNVSGWLWQHAASATGTGSMSQMSLSNGNALTLYDQTTPTPNAAIVLDPLGTSSFGTSASFNGTNNLMPNQTITGNNSVLTVALADARYLVYNNGYKLSIGAGATATGEQSTAVGYLANASGPVASAIGFAATASGADATALGWGALASGNVSTALGVTASATNAYSTALGWNTQASGTQSSALGISSIADGDYSMAVGENSHASGTNSAAFGQGSLASGGGSCAIGAGSRATGVASNAFGFGSAATNDQSLALNYASTASGYASAALGFSSLAAGELSTAFGVCSGASSFASQALGYHAAADGNAALALGNYSHAGGSCSTALGNSTVATGDFSVAAGLTPAAGMYQCTVGAYGLSGGNAHYWVATDDLFTVGNGQSAAAPSNALSVKKNGDMTVNGNLNVVKAIIVQPQGDLSMGEFTATPSPSPTP